MAPATTTRTRLPRRRRSNTFAFRVADCEGYVTVGEYEDGRPGEVFMKVSKQGSTLSGVMDAFSISVSLGLQHGVPLSTFVRKYTNMRFEPAGITDDAGASARFEPRRLHLPALALDYLQLRRARSSSGSSRPASGPSRRCLASRTSRRTGGARSDRERFGAGGDAAVARPAMPKARPAPQMESRDAPSATRAATSCSEPGSCYACPSCGATSGCS